MKRPKGFLDVQRIRSIMLLWRGGHQDTQKATKFVWKTAKSSIFGLFKDFSKSGELYRIMMKNRTFGFVVSTQS